MATEIKVPTLGESVTEATVAQWFKKVGEAVGEDEPIVELETDKVTLEVNAPVAGVLAEIVAEEGAEVEVGALLGKIDEDGKATAAPKKTEEKKEAKAEAAPAAKQDAPTKTGGDAPLSPAVKVLIEENKLSPADIPATGVIFPGRVAILLPTTGKDGRLTKGDVLDYLAKGGDASADTSAPSSAQSGSAAPRETGPREERVKMSRLRRRIAERLKEAQDTARSTPRFTATRSSTRTITISALPSAPRTAWSSRWSAMRTHLALPKSKRRSASWAGRRATASCRWRICPVAPSPSPTAACMAR